MRRRLTTLAIALAALLLVGPAAACARGGGHEFGGGGLVPGTGSRMVAYGSDFSVARLLPGGALDTSFGSGGFAKVSFPRYQGARSTGGAVQLGGRILLTGFVTLRCHPRRGNHCGRKLAFARFLASGRPDPSFGNHGKVVTNFDRGGVVGRAYSVVTTGRQIYVAGVLGAGWPAVGRLRFDGSPDPRFGENGVAVLTSLPAEAGILEDGLAENLAVDSYGRVLVAVRAWPAGSPYRAGLVRLDRDGKIDRSFAEDGFLSSGIGFGHLRAYHPPSSERDPDAEREEPDIARHPFGFAVLPDASILISAATLGPPGHLVLMHVLADGSADRAYGLDGFARGPDSVQVRFGAQIVPTPDGRAYVGVADFLHTDLLRFLPDGSLDPSFGSAGVAPQLESWGARASLSVLGDGSVALADDLRQTSGLLIGRYGADGAPLSSTSLP